MVSFARKRSTGIQPTASTPVAESTTWVVPARPAGHVAVTRPDGASEESLRGNYPLTGKILGPSSNCSNCFKDGYISVNGSVQYCPCQFDQILFAKLASGTA